MRVEVVDSVAFSQLIEYHEACLENVFKQLKLLRLAIKRSHWCGERIRLFGKLVKIVIKFCKIVDVCQLLKGQQNWCASIVLGIFSLRNSG